MMIASRYEVPAETRGELIASIQRVSPYCSGNSEQCGEQLMGKEQFSLEAFSPERPSSVSEPPNWE